MLLPSPPARVTGAENDRRGQRRKTAARALCGLSRMSFDPYVGVPVEVSGKSVADDLSKLELLRLEEEGWNHMLHCTKVYFSRINNVAMKS